MVRVPYWGKTHLQSTLFAAPHLSGGEYPDMPSLDIAHLRQQGVDMIIVPLDHTFDNKSPQERASAIREIQYHAHEANLAGTVVPVWDNGGRMAFIAPNAWHPFFRSLNVQDIRRNINKTLSW